MDLPFEQLLILVIAAVALVLRFLRRRPLQDGNAAISSQPTPAPYFPDEDVETWPPPSRPVARAHPAHRPMRTPPAASPPALARRPAQAPASGPTVPTNARLRVAPALVQPRMPWLAPVARDRNSLRRAIVLLTVLGPPRALAPFADHGPGDVHRS